MKTFAQFIIEFKEVQPLRITPDQHNDFVEHRKSFTPEHVKAMRRYKNASNVINDHLRNETGKHNPQLIKHLDHVTSQTIKHPIVVYRGFRNVDLSKMKPGDEFVDHGYTGTSLNPSNAVKWADYQNHTHPALGRIHVPAGAKGHFFGLA